MAANAYGVVKGGKLTFKGGVPVGRVSGAAAGPAAGSSGGSGGSGGATKRKAEAAPEQTEGWVRVNDMVDLSGPLFLCTNGDEKCIYVTEDGEVRLQKAPASHEPDTVGQVLVAHTIQPNVVVFKSAYGKYLTADKFGLVSATAEAIGPQQEWTPILRDEGLALQSKYEKFLKFEDDRNTVRADSESAGFCEIYSVRCQAARRAEQRKKAVQRAAAEKPVTELETETAKRFQSWGMGRVKLANDDTDLRAASREGALAGALLDRRTKVKSDKYCK